MFIEVGLLNLLGVENRVVAQMVLLVMDVGVVLFTLLWGEVKESARVVKDLSCSGLDCGCGGSLCGTMKVLS